MQNLQVGQPLFVVLLETKFADADLISQRLLRSGFPAEICLVKNEPELISALLYNPDLILADLQPDGFNALRAMTILQGEARQPPLIILCAEDQQELALDCLHDGAADYLPGENLLRLGHCITQILKSRQLDEELNAARRLPPPSPDLRIARDLTPEHYRGLFENSRDIFLFIDPESGQILDINSKAEQVYGYSRDELLGMTIGQLENQENAEEMARYLRLANSDGTVFETLQRRRDGSVLPVEISSYGIDLETGRVILQNIRDIGPRKHAEEALEANRRTLQLFVENAPAAIAMFDCDMHYLAASRRYLVDYHLGQQELIGRSHYEIFPEIPERWKQIHRRCLAGSTERCDEDPFPREDGSLDWVRWEILPWRDFSGNIGGIILLSEVITQQKLILEKLKQSERQLTDSQRLAHLGNYQIEYPEEEMLFSEEVSRILGISPSQNSLTMAEYTQFIYFADIDHFQKAFDASVINRESYDIEYRIVTPDNEQKHIRNIGNPIVDEQGQIIRVMGILLDITAGKLSAQVIAQSEEKYRTLVQASVDAIAMADESGRVIAWNQGAERIFGLDQEQVLGQTLWDVQFWMLPENKRTPEAREYHRRSVLSMLQTGVSPWKDRPFKTTFQRVDGSIGVMSSLIYTVKSVNGYLLCSIARDVTEQEQAEEDLRETNELLHTIIQASPLAISVIDQQRNLKLWSPAAERLFGWRAEEVLGKPLPTFPAEQLEEINRQVNDELNGRSQIGLEIDRLRKDGSKMAVRLSTAPLRDAQGQIIGSMAMYEDITLRKQVELELMVSEQKFRALVEHSSDGIMLLDEQGTVIEWNRASEGVSGLPRERAMGRSIWDVQFQLIAPDRRLPERYEYLKHSIQLLLQTGQSTLSGHPLDATVQGRDGKKRYTQQVIFPIPTRDGFRVGSITRDVTDQKTAEMALRQSQEKFSKVFHASPVAMALSRVGGEFLEVNQALVDLTGYPREELIGHSSIELGLYDDPVVYEALLKEIGKKPLREIEITFRGRDHRIFICNSSFEFFEMDGILLSIGIYENITERKRTEAALRDSQSLLDSIINSTSDLIGSVDAHNFGLTLFNQGMQDFFWNYRGMQIQIGMSPEELFPAAHGSHPWVEFYQRALREGAFTVEYPTFKGNRTLLLSMQPLMRDGEAFGVSIFAKDITEQKLIEQRLRESEAGLRKAQQVSHVGSWKWDITTNQVKWSDEMFPIFGIDKALFTGSLAEVIAWAIHPDDREKVNQANLRVVQENNPIPLEYRILWPDQTVHWVWGEAGELILDANGSPAFLTGIVQDITERKRAEEILRESEERYHMLFELSPDAIIIQKQGNFELANPAALRLFGAESPDQILGRPFLERVHPQYQAAVAERIHILNEEKQHVPAFEEIYLRLDGTMVDVEVIAAPFMVDAEAGAIAIARDITQRKAAEKALGLVEERFHDLFVNIVEGISIYQVLWDEQGNVEDWILQDSNPASARYFSLPLDLALGQRATYLFGRENVQDYFRICKEVMAEGRGRQFETYFAASGTWHQDWVAPLGPDTYATGNLDITERKKTEQALIESEKKYRGLFTQMTSGSALHEMIYAADGKAVDYVTLDANAAYFSLLEVSIDAAIGKKASEILPPDELKRWIKIFEPVATRGIAIHYEMYSPTNGKYFEGTAYSTEKGRFAVIFADVTAYRQSEKALRESEERFRTLIEKAPAAIVIARNGIPIYGNHLILKMMEYSSQEEFLKVPIVDNIAPAHQQAALEYIRLRALNKATPDTFESIARRRDGTEFPMQSAIAYIQLSDGPANMTIISDITAQKQAEQEIRRQAAYANALVKLTSRLSTAPELDKVLRVLCEEILTALNLPGCAIYLFDEQDRMLTPYYNHGIPSNLWTGLHRILIQPGSETELPDQIFSQPELTQNWPAGLFLSSMIYQDQLVGAVALPSPPSWAAAGEEWLLVHAFAREGAIAIINYRLNAETRNRARELEDLADVSSSLRQARTLAEMVPLLVAKTVQVLQADSGVLIFYPEDRFSSNILPHLPQPNPEWKAVLDQLNLQKIPEDAQAFFPSDFEEHKGNDLPAPQPESKAIITYALAMVKSVESLIGFLFVGYNHHHTFQEDEKRLLIAIAEIAGNAIHRSNVMETLEQHVQVRTRELEVLYDIARLTSGSIDLDAVLFRTLDRVLEIYHAESGLIQLLNHDGDKLELSAHRGFSDQAIQRLQKIPMENSQAAMVIRDKQAHLSLNLAKDLAQSKTGGEKRADVYLGAPIRAKGEVLGVVSIYGDALTRFNVEEIALLETIANQIGVAVESARLRQQSEQTAILEERQRLARDLHDSVTQSLFSLNLLAEGYRQHVTQATPEELEEWFAELGDSAHQALKDMRLLLYELRPTSIQQDGLVAAIRRRLDAVEGRSGIKSQLMVEGDPGLLSKADEVELYRIVQEALNNSLKHAFAMYIEIKLFLQPNHIRMEIRDNGMGFEIATLQTEGMGLASMKERAKRLHGKLEIKSRPGKGTVVKFSKRG